MNTVRSRIRSIAELRKLTAMTSMMVEQFVILFPAGQHVRQQIQNLFAPQPIE
jgi:hypothetical protein